MYDCVTTNRLSRIAGFTCKPTFFTQRETAASSHPDKKARSKSAREWRSRSLASAIVVPDRTCSATAPHPLHECVSLARTDLDTLFGSVTPSTRGIVWNSSSDCRRLGSSQSTVAVREFAEQGVCGTFFEHATRESTVGTQVAPSLPVDSLASGDRVVWFASAVAVRSGCSRGAVQHQRLLSECPTALRPHGSAPVLFLSISLCRLDPVRFRVTLVSRRRGRHPCRVRSRRWAAPSPCNNSSARSLGVSMSVASRRESTSRVVASSSVATCL